MMRRIVAGGILTLAFMTGCSSRSQDRVVVAPAPHAVRREPVREVIVVERTHVPRGRAYGWWKQHGYREVTLYYDGDRYSRLESTGFRAVIVYQRDGKYYRPDADGDDRDHHGHGKHKDNDNGKDEDKGKDKDNDKDN